MRSSILALLAGSVMALASPAFRVSITLDEGKDLGSSSQDVMSIDDPFNVPYPFIMQTTFQNFIVSPQQTDSGQILILSPRTGNPLETFQLRDGQLITGGMYGPPLSVFQYTDGPPTLVLGPTFGAPNLRRLQFGAGYNPDFDGLVLMQYDDNTCESMPPSYIMQRPWLRYYCLLIHADVAIPPRPLSLLGPPFPGTPIGVADKGQPVFIRVQPTV